MLLYHDIIIPSYYYRRFRGASPACPTPRNRELNFDFDFDSFGRSGEAKLCGHVRGMLPQRWGWDPQRVLVVLGWVFAIVAGTHVDFH